MPESTLSLTIDDLKAEIGHYLGYSRGTVFGEGTWTVYQTNNITAVLKTGLSQVYTPPPLSPNEPPHSWSFLRPYATLTLTSGQKTCALPEGFGGFESPLLIIDPSTSRSIRQIKVTSDAKVHYMHSLEPTTTGAPRIACEDHLDGTGYNHSTRSQLLVWPIPDANYILEASWKHHPDVLTGSYRYPPGGAEHAELFKASVIYAAAVQVDDDPGVREAAFMQRLAASVHADRKRKGTYIGYNRDNSDARNRNMLGSRGSWRFYDNSAVTYNGGDL